MKQTKKVVVEPKPYIKGEFKNKCFAKDLTITFSMGALQKIRKMDSIERYETVMKTKDYQQFNSFEYFQMKVSTLIAIPSNYSFIYSIGEFYFNENKNQYEFKPIEFLKAIESVKRDRSGLISSTFLKSVINNGPEFEYLKTKPPSKSYYNQNVPYYLNKSNLNEWETTCAKFDQENGLIYKMITNKRSSPFYSTLKILINREIKFGLSSSSHTSHTYPIDNNQPYHYILEKETGLKTLSDENNQNNQNNNENNQNDENNQNNENDQNDNNNNKGWVVKNEFPFGFFLLPNLKEICFSVLKEMFLISNKSVIDKLFSPIKSIVPISLLQEFLVDCFNDEKPVGNEIIFKIYSKSLCENYDSILSNINFPLNDLLSSCIKRDSWFRYNYDMCIAQDLFYQPYKENFAINVYENLNLFKFKLIPIENRKNILFEKTGGLDDFNSLITGDQSIVDKSMFISNFNRLTNNRFNKTFDDGESGFEKLKKLDCVFIGGIITNCLIQNDGNDVCEGFEKSDIDICFFNTTNDFYAQVARFVDMFFKGVDRYESEASNSCSVVFQGNHVTICQHYPNRHIQLNLYSHLSIEDVLIGVDIDATCFAFDGIDIWCLERAMHSINYRINIASEHSFLIRGDANYQYRLLKYLKRGFDIYYLSTPQIDKIINQANFDSQSKSNSPPTKDFTPSLRHVGFSLLLSLRMDSTLYTPFFKTKKRSETILPYGPNVDDKEFKRWVGNNYNKHYDGYNSDDILQLLETPISEMYMGQRDSTSYNHEWINSLNDRSSNYVYNEDYYYNFEEYDDEEDDDGGEPNYPEYNDA
ncbi:hypothetical protein ACTFIW_008967 [Dictyostelium discoideum]